MKKQDLQKLIREEAQKILKEKINFSIGSEANPDKKMKDSFSMQFKSPMKAVNTLTKLSDKLKEEGFGELDFEYVGIVINKPTANQMNAILKAFNQDDIDGMGRI